ncbi:MAG: nitroreductase family protein [Dehalococcoidales bacterium]|nr:nitroreductase family protein [Dehalococcoidales bacterium]
MNSTNQYDCLLDIARKRRTIRQFKPDPVPDEYITKIIEVARWAPSAFHTQPWEFVIVKDPDVKNKVVAALERHGPPIKDPAKAAVARRSFKDAPVFILLLCDWRASVGLPGNAGADKARAAGLYASSLANAFLLMHLAATSLGLASQWYTATSRPDAESAIKKIIGIPGALTIYDMMVLGYPDAPADTKIIRDVAGMTHYNRCGVGDFRTDEQVLDYAAKTKAWCLSQH